MISEKIVGVAVLGRDVKSDAMWHVPQLDCKQQNHCYLTLKICIYNNHHSSIIIICS